jgi:hypothetical protein
MVAVTPTLEFKKSDHVYLRVTNTKEVVILLFGWYTRNVSKMHNDFFIFIMRVPFFPRVPLPSIYCDENFLKGVGCDTPGVTVATNDKLKLQFKFQIQMFLKLPQTLPNSICKENPDSHMRVVSSKIIFLKVLSGKNFGNFS